MEAPNSSGFCVRSHWRSNPVSADLICPRSCGEGLHQKPCSA